MSELTPTPANAVRIRYTRGRERDGEHVTDPENVRGNGPQDRLGLLASDIAEVRRDVRENRFDLKALRSEVAAGFKEQREAMAAGFKEQDAKREELRAEVVAGFKEQREAMAAGFKEQDAKREELVETVQGLAETVQGLATTVGVLAQQVAEQQGVLQRLAASVAVLEQREAERQPVLQRLAASVAVIEQREAERRQTGIGLRVTVLAGLALLVAGVLARPFLERAIALLLGS